MFGKKKPASLDGLSMPSILTTARPAHAPWRGKRVARFCERSYLETPGGAHLLRPGVEFFGHVTRSRLCCQLVLPPPEICFTSAIHEPVKIVFFYITLNQDFFLFLWKCHWLIFFFLSHCFRWLTNEPALNIWYRIICYFVTHPSSHHRVMYHGVLIISQPTTNTDIVFKLWWFV